MKTIISSSITNITTKHINLVHSSNLDGLFNVPSDYNTPEYWNDKRINTYQAAMSYNRLGAPS